jgi:hypothetical protein
MVDTARLETLRRETDQVGALLAEVFAEEELTSLPQIGTSDQASAAAATSDEVLLPGLDLKHQQFLTTLLSKSSWTRKELQDVAAHLQIMLDGALERVNEAAFDLAGEPVTEGDDPIYVQQSILEAAE